MIICNSGNCVLDFSLLQALNVVNVTEDKRPLAKVVCVSVGDGNSMCSVDSGEKCCIF